MQSNGRSSKRGGGTTWNPPAENPLVLLGDRAEVFSPIKNATGVDGPATARRDMIRRSAGWLEQSCL